MSVDIQVISVVDDLQVISQEDIEDAEPRTIRVVSRGGFNNAQRVIINNLGLDSFLIISDTVLLVEPGSSFDNVPVQNMDIVVVSSALTGTRRARLFFGPTKRLKRVNGVQKLIQHIVKMLLTNSNTNKFRLSEGGNLLKLLAFPLTPASQSRIVTGLSQAISSVEDQLVSSQTASVGLAADERLLSLSLGEVVFLQETLEVQATVRLVTFAGNTVNVPLVL
jgi:phage baseplate assembly protein W